MKQLSQGLSLLSLLISIILILLMVFGVVSLTNKNSQTLDSLTFEMQQQNFQQNLALMRSQWLLEKRPKQLQFAFYDEQGEPSHQELFTMSNNGWPMLPSSEIKNYCQRLFVKITNAEANEHYKQVFKAIKLQKEGDISCQFCDAGDNQNCFNYSIH